MDDLRARLKQIYNEYRTALLNCKYYAHRLEQYRRRDLVAEIVVALGTSSAIGSWAIWKTSFGKNGWTFLAGVAVIASVLKPILQFSKSIEKYGKLFSGYNSIAVSFRFLVSEIKIKKMIDESSHQAIQRLFEQIRELAKDDDPNPPRRLLLRLFKSVNIEVPPTSLWMPKLAAKEEAHG